MTLTTISFTAARTGFSPAPPVVASVLSARVPDADRYVTGACRGGDSWIGQWLAYRKLSAEHVVVVPASHGQIDPWWTRVPAGRRRITVIQMPPGTSYADRNQRLVDLADWVFGFPAYPEDDPRSLRSGTWQTIRMSGKAGKLSQWHCVTPPYTGRIEAVPGKPWYREGQPVLRPAYAWADDLANAGLRAIGALPPASLMSCPCGRGDFGACNDCPYGWCPVHGRHQARRDDDVDRWLKRKRDELDDYGWQAVVRGAIDDLLDDYRLHADTGTPLNAEVNER